MLLNTSISNVAFAALQHDAASHHSAGTGSDRGGPPPSALHIFVNRLKYGAAQGVRPTMTGRQIAALARVPAELAVVRRGSGSDAEPVGIDETLSIHQAEHFMVTRCVVEGGHAC
jgi:hypothetical protein